mmetsp:Transcript_25114/g.53191  ORF Transcript_25114/g.53191 Transcript_25114/m.53191 type:complete len:315 (-) Transcript_25114:329-1273(-)
MVLSSGKEGPSDPSTEATTSCSSPKPRPSSMPSSGKSLCAIGGGEGHGFGDCLTSEMAGVAQTTCSSCATAPLRRLREQSQHPNPSQDRMQATMAISSQRGNGVRKLSFRKGCSPSLSSSSRSPLLPTSPLTARNSSSGKATSTPTIWPVKPSDKNTEFACAMKVLLSRSCVYSAVILTGGSRSSYLISITCAWTGWGWRRRCPWSAGSTPMPVMVAMFSPRARVATKARNSKLESFASSPLLRKSAFTSRCMLPLRILTVPGGAAALVFVVVVVVAWMPVYVEVVKVVVEVSNVPFEVFKVSAKLKVVKVVVV